MQKKKKRILEKNLDDLAKSQENTCLTSDWFVLVVPKFQQIFLVIDFHGVLMF